MEADCLLVEELLRHLVSLSVCRFVRERKYDTGKYTNDP